MRGAILCVLVTVAALGADPAWDGLASHTGKKLTVVLQGGTETRGKLERVSERDLSVGGKRFLKEQVLEVYTRDSAWPGGAIGAAAGYGAGWALLAIAKGRDGDWAWSDGAELFGPIGAAAGFPIGYVIDRAWGERKVLYAAPARAGSSSAARAPGSRP